jgi:hypothetical protein
MQPSTMQRWFKRCLQQAGAADFPMHELRNTAGNEFRPLPAISSRRACSCGTLDLDDQRALRARRQG